jgi:hypothetical protein
MKDFYSMKILVIGSTCRIGQKLVAVLKQQSGHDILQESHFKSRWRFGDTVNLDGIDRIIILAHDRSVDEQTHLIYIRNLLKDYVGKIVYLSTMSANKNSLSRYGRAKSIIEHEILESGGLVVRSGIVWDSQIFGILKKLAFLSRFPIVFYPKADLMLFQMTNINDLISCLVKHSLDFEPGLIYALNNQTFTFRDLLKAFAPRRIFFVKVSNRLIYFTTKAIRALRMKEIADSISILLERNSLIPKSHSCLFRCFDRKEITL